MAKKKKVNNREVKFKNPDTKMETIDLSEVASDTFREYSAYVLKNRSIPDVRDGLLPVQRRNLYSMYNSGYTHKGKTVKSAKIVGNVMGNYHPHGDSAIYGALARMSKDWIMGKPMVNMEGNNGNIDGDSEAAMRYTESKLHKYSEDILLSNLALKGIVPEKLNFDDTELEPEYLPAKIPNILINGSEGIAVGYASSIPPFNLEEVIDACIAEIENPEIEDLELLTHIPAPDLPTGGLIADYTSYKDVLVSGKGSIKVRGTYVIEEDKENKEIHILFKEIPYGVSKIKIVTAINESIDKKEISGVKEVIDESSIDNGLQILIRCTESANIDGILAYLFTKTPLQSNVNLNMTTIINGKPKTVGVPRIIREFNKFRLMTFVKGLQIQISDFKKKQHINEGYVMLVDNIEEVIAIIKESSSKKESRETLMERIGFSEIQANRVLDMALNRLNKTDNEGFKNVVAECIKQIKARETILSSEELIRKAVVSAYNKTKEQYPTPRKTVLKSEPEIWNFNPESIIPKENIAIGISEDGLLRASNFRSYKSSNVDNDDTKFILETDTKQNLIFVASNGMYSYIPVHKLPLSRWSDSGKHVSTFGIDIGDSKIVFAGLFDGEDKEKTLFLLKNSGVGKQSKVIDYVKNKGFFRAKSGIKVSEGEEVIGGWMLDPSEENFIAIMDNQYANMYFEAEEMPITSIGSGGSAAMRVNRKKDRYVSEFVLYHDKEDIPPFCQPRERGKAGWNRTKSEEPVSLYEWVKPVEEQEESQVEQENVEE